MPLDGHVNVCSPGDAFGVRMRTQQITVAHADVEGLQLLIKDQRIPYRAAAELSPLTAPGFRCEVQFWVLKWQRWITGHQVKTPHQSAGVPPRRGVRRIY